MPPHPKASESLLRSAENESAKSVEIPGFLEHFPTPFFIVDRNLVITYMNGRLEELTGFCAKEVLNRLQCAQVLSTPQCNTDDCLLKRAMETKQPVSGLRRTIVDRNGRSVPVVVYASIITNAEGEVVGGFEAIRDISPIIEAEQTIRLLTEMTQEGILMVDEDYRVAYVNKRMTEILGLSREELLGLDARELLPSQHLDMMDRLMLEASQQEQVRFCSIFEPDSIRAKKFETLETCMGSVRVSTGVLTCLYFRDLARHIEVERELRKANSFLKNIIRSSVSGIVVVDTEGKVLIFNEGAERILGYTADEVVGDPDAFNRFYKPEIAREIMRRMRSSEDGPEGKLLTTRVPFYRKDGQQVPVSLSAAVIKEGDTELGSVGIFTDLSEEFRIRKELEDARIQLLQAEKIASLGRLSAGVAHEINNPLAGILIYADLLMKEIGHNPQWKQDLQEIINQTLRCKQIVNRLLEFSRQPLGQRIAFDPNEVINRCLELLGYQTLFHDIEFELGLQADLPRIVGDPGQIQQVCTNIIINAACAMSGRGKISITSRFDAAFGGVVLSFSDTGPGIPMEIRDKIFEPFFTTKPPREGTGLGLSVVYGIIQKHGGRIEVMDAESGGAVFIIVLPLEPPENQTEVIEDWSPWIQS